MKEFENKVMLSMDIPRYFYLDQSPPFKLSAAEIDFEKRMKASVIQVHLKDDRGAHKITELFNTYGDINVTTLP